MCRAGQLTRRMRVLTTGIGAIAGYAALIAWFGWADVYNAHFFASGPLILLYNLLRLVLAVAIAWLVYAPGYLVLAIVAGFPAVRILTTGERYALGFFTGAGLWHAVLFGV